MVSFIGEGEERPHLDVLQVAFIQGRRVTSRGAHFRLKRGG
jgi:hypothetical protein